MISKSFQSSLDDGVKCVSWGPDAMDPDAMDPDAMDPDAMDPETCCSLLASRAKYY